MARNIGIGLIAAIISAAITWFVLGGMSASDPRAELLPLPPRAPESKTPSAQIIADAGSTGDVGSGDAAGGENIVDAAVLDATLADLLTEDANPADLDARIDDVSAVKAVKKSPKKRKKHRRKRKRSKRKPRRKKRRKTSIKAKVKWGG